jgi:BirA family transcriptional regulator, biotin operon repressor / biotin---[acetyl-CoA-carboxylase] ligase
MITFNQQLLETYLQQDAKLTFPVSLKIFDTVNSTNQTLWEMIDTGITEPTAIIALKQTKGKGQWGRTWQSLAGGLYLSVGLFPQIPIENSAQITLAVASGIANNLRSHHIPVLLKWLNDLILDGKKLGGILTETRIKQGQISKIVIGVGINFHNIVPETAINLTSYNINLEKLAAIAITGIISGYQQLCTEGIETILLSYLKLLTNIGQETDQGIVTGVSPTGELCLQLKEYEIRLKPGAISLGYNNLTN